MPGTNVIGLQITGQMSHPPAQGVYFRRFGRLGFLAEGGLVTIVAKDAEYTGGSVLVTATLSGPAGLTVWLKNGSKTVSGPHDSLDPATEHSFVIPWPQALIGQSLTVVYEVVQP